ncbi:galactose oxidase [Thozetella sp. PMI_491]|nr:galactose oxidase [Thozetella sp. PMI_491]
MRLSRATRPLSLAYVLETTIAAQWTNLVPIPFPRQEHSTVAINETTIAIVGGTTPTGNASYVTGLSATSLMQLYDIPSDTWRTVAPTPYKVNHPNVAVVGGKLYLLGGLVNIHEPPTNHSDWAAFGESYVWDPTTDLWTQLTSMPTGTERGSATMGVQGDMIYLAGGMTLLQGTYQDAITTVTAFNTTSGEWQRLPALAANIPERRQHSVGAFLTTHFLSSADVAGWKTSSGSMPVPRGGLSGAAVGNQFYTFGGEANSNSPSGIFNQTEAFDMETQQWEELKPMAVPRHGNSAVAVGNKIYIPGGGLQQDGKAYTIDGVTHYIQTTDHFDAYCV